MIRFFRYFMIVSLAVVWGILGYSSSFAANIDIREDARSGENRPGYIDKVLTGLDGYFFRTTETGEKGVQNFALRVARDGKNMVIVVAVIYLFIAIFQLIGSDNKIDAEAKKVGPKILWTVLGIAIMQVMYFGVSLLYNKDFGTQGGTIATSIFESILLPIINIITLIASFIFMAVAIFGAYLMITDAGDGSSAKKGKSAIINAAIGFGFMFIIRRVIDAFYGVASCTTSSLKSICQIQKPDLKTTVGLVIQIINYANGFLALICVLSVLYAGFLVLTAPDDDAKRKTARNIIIGAALGLGLIFLSMLILQFVVTLG